MKKMISVSIVFILAACISLSIVWVRSRSSADNTVLATVGGAPITQSDVLLVQSCDSIVHSAQGNHDQVISEDEALKRLISERIKQQMIQDEGIHLSDEEQKQTRDTILWSFDEANDILQNGTDQEKEMAEQNMAVIQDFVKAYGVSMEEYKELCINSTIFSIEISKLADKKFGGDKDALEAYVQNNYGEYQVVING